MALNLLAIAVMVLAGGWLARLVVPGKVPRSVDAIPGVLLIGLGAAWIASTLLHPELLRLCWYTSAIAALVMQVALGPVLAVGGALAIVVALRARSVRSIRFGGQLAVVVMLGALWLGAYAVLHPRVFRVVGIAPLE